MRIRRASVLLLLATSCRIPLAVDTSGSKFIPREIAVERLKEVLATADAVSCTEPKHSLSRAEIKEWKVDDLGFEALADGKEPIRVAFKDVAATGVDQLNTYYQLKIFTAAQPNPGKGYVRINWKLETPVRRALELIDALWKKPSSKSVSPSRTSSEPSWARAQSSDAKILSPAGRRSEARSSPTYS